MPFFRLTNDFSWIKTELSPRIGHVTFLSDDGSKKDLTHDDDGDLMLLSRSLALNNRY